MGPKKGKVPAHIQPKQFQHPGIDSSWVFILNQVKDPRNFFCNTPHSITSILFIVFITVICKAKNWQEMYYSAEGEGFVKCFGSCVNLSRGIPFRWTFERVTSLIPTAQLQPLFVRVHAGVGGCE